MGACALGCGEDFEMNGYTYLSVFAYLAAFANAPEYHSPSWTSKLNTVGRQRKMLARWFLLLWGDSWGKYETQSALKLLAGRRAKAVGQRWAKPKKPKKESARANWKRRQLLLPGLL